MLFSCVVSLLSLFFGLFLPFFGLFSIFLHAFSQRRTWMSCFQRSLPLRRDGGSGTSGTSAGPGWRQGPGSRQGPAAHGLLTRCKVRVAARKLYVFFGAIIVIGFLVLISIIGVRSQVVSGLIPAAPAAGLSQHPCSCPRLWIGIEKKCSYFDREKNQTWSRADCHARSAYRAVIRSKEEQVFVLCNNSSPYYWTPLSHQNLSQRWESDEVTLFNSSLFLIRGDEDFAFLNNQTVTSVCSSSSKLRWICSGQP